MTQFGEKCKKKIFALLNIVGFIVAFIVEFNLTMLKTLTATNLDTLPLMPAKYSPNINPEQEQVHHQKHQVPSEHRRSMCSDPYLV